MKLLETIKGVFTIDTFECPDCGYAPDEPSDEFSINYSASRSGSDFKKYDCPECTSTFQAIICDCGRGYQSRMSFKNVIQDGQHGEQERYKCGCGETLHIHHRH